MSDEQPTNRDLLNAITDLKARFDAVDDRLNQLQADLETGFAEVRGQLGSLALGQINLFNLIVGHTTDPGAHRRTA